MDALLNSLADSELTLVRETEPDRLADLDEDGLVALHKRIRRARNKYSKVYRREAGARVAEQGGRGKARRKNTRSRQKAEVFEDALARVSRSLAVAARQTATQLKSERLSAAKATTGPRSRPRGRRRPGRVEAGASPPARHRRYANGTRPPSGRGGARPARQSLTCDNRAIPGSRRARHTPRPDAGRRRSAAVQARRLPVPRRARPRTLHWTYERPAPPRPVVLGQSARTATPAPHGAAGDDGGGGQLRLRTRGGVARAQPAGTSHAVLEPDPRRAGGTGLSPARRAPWFCGTDAGAPGRRGMPALRSVSRRRQGTVGRVRAASGALPDLRRGPADRLGRRHGPGPRGVRGRPGRAGRAGGGGAARRGGRGVAGARRPGPAARRGGPGSALRAGGPGPDRAGRGRLGDRAAAGHRSGRAGRGRARLTPTGSWSVSSFATAGCAPGPSGRARPPRPISCSR